MPTDPDSPPARFGRGDWVAWLAGGLFAVFLIGPGWGGPAGGSGAIVNLDHLTLPHLDLPTVWTGTGPELPRRAPFMALASLASPLGGSALVIKLLIVLLTAGACAGMERMCRALGSGSGIPPGRWLSVGAGLVYVAGPFLVTRIVVGHLGVLWAAAVLPWGLTTFLRPGEDVRRTFRWSLLLALGGYLSGTMLVGILPAAVMVSGFGRRTWRGLAALLLPQALWAVPGVAVAWADSFVQPGAASFAPRLSGWGAPFELLIGQGFFHDEAGAAPTPLWQAVPVACGLVAAAWAGRGARSPERTGRLAVFAVGSGVALLGALPGVSGGWNALTDLPVLNLLREGHRLYLVAWLVLVPAAASGLARIAPRSESAGPLLRVAPAATAFILAAPNLWGASHQLDSVAIPASWERAREMIRADPGPVLVVPLHQYLRVPFAEGRRSHQLLPAYLGGDALVSTDAEVDSVGTEVDPRVLAVRRALNDFLFGVKDTASEGVRSAGVAWLAVVASPDSGEFRSLLTDPGLELRMSEAEVAVFEVTHRLRSPRAHLGGLVRVAPHRGPLPVSGAGGWVGSTPWTTGDGGIFRAERAGWWVYLPGAATHLTQLVLVVGALWSVQDQRGHARWLRSLSLRVRHG